MHSYVVADACVPTSFSRFNLILIELNAGNMRYVWKYTSVATHTCTVQIAAPRVYHF